MFSFNDKRKYNIAIFGCGGTGSELIKLLKDHCLTLIDYDKIELSNLNRQFLYTINDCGKFKAEVAAYKTGCKYKVCRLEDLSPIDLNEYDMVISCLDNVGSRMELNYLFKQSKARLFVDCGVEGLQAHVKKVDRNNACLYCIKELYHTNGETYLCSLSDTSTEITEFNREKVLKSIIYREKEKALKLEEEPRVVIRKIIKEFNEKVIQGSGLETNEFEVEGDYYSIVSNVCFINSIAASLVILMIFTEVEYDFIFYDGTNKPLLKKLKLEKAYDCLYCKIGNDNNLLKK
ncbi:NEDD8-activating enzyme E1 [Pancytospora epiphaga]|nr:NEDD8-activating enzyme E1 [Pancytospora epiphaga]